MGYNPSNIFQEIFSGMNLIAPSAPSIQNISASPRKSILNLGEYFMQPKNQNSNNYFLPSVNTHADALHINGRFKFPDSREGSATTSQRVPSFAHHYNHLIKGDLPKNPISFQKPELKQEQSINKNILIDHRGAVEHIFGKNNMNYKQNLVNPTTYSQPSRQHYQQQHHHQNINYQPLQSIRTSNAVETQPIQHQAGGKQFLLHQMPFVQYVQTSYAFPPQIQIATPNNQLLLQQPDQTTFRYQMPILDFSNIYSQPLSTPAFQYLPKVTQYQPIQNFVRFDVVNSTSKNFQQSEKMENKNYSPPDPVYFPSTTENYARVTTYSSDPSKYKFIINSQIDPPVSTASSRKVNSYNDNGFQPMESPFKISGIKQLQNHVENNTEETPFEVIVAKKPNSINSQLTELGTAENITIPYVSLPDDPQKAIHSIPTDSIKKIINEEISRKTENYDIILKRPTFHQKTTEKPILKWIPKKNRDKSTTSSPSTIFQSPFYPTPIPTATTTTLSVPKKHFVTNIPRGRNRFNSRRTSTTTSTPMQLTSKVYKKKFRTTTSPTTKTTSPTPIPFEFSTVFPTYVLTESTQEPFTLQSFSTSISLVVGGSETVKTTEIPKGYEMVQAGVVPLVTNLTNIKLYRASVSVENEFSKTPDFDNLTFSILNHARAIETVENDENN